MSSWFRKIAPNILPGNTKKNSVPEGVWIKCPNCKETLYSRDLDKNMKVCPSCSYHFRLSVYERVHGLIDYGTFNETNKDIQATDPLKFSDSKKYKDRLKSTIAKSESKDAIVTGLGEIHGKKVSLAVFNFKFMGGSMGSVVGEKITRAIEDGIDKHIPVIVVSASGGARMQEGIFSLMQMAKTSAALHRLEEKGLPYISILTDPTTGGVSASFAMLGDIIIAEPGSLVCFAGPRVIQQTIKQELPDGFQRAEFLLEHGSIDMVVNRLEMKDTLSNLLGMLTAQKRLQIPAKT